MVSEQTIPNSTPNLIQCELCKSLSKTIITLYPQGDNGWQSSNQPLFWISMKRNDEQWWKKKGVELGMLALPFALVFVVSLQ